MGSAWAKLLIGCPQARDDALYILEVIPLEGDTLCIPKPLLLKRQLPI